MSNSQQIAEAKSYFMSEYKNDWEWSMDVPQFFVKGKYIGGLDELKTHLETL